METNLAAQLKLFQDRYNKLHQELLNAEYELIIKNQLIEDLTKQLPNEEVKTDGD